MDDHDEAIDDFLQFTTFGEDPYSSFNVRAAEAGLPAIQVSVVFAKFLQLLVRAIDARVILEVGTLGGYSAAWMASALGAGGRLTSLEIDPTHAAVARDNLASVELGDAVHIIEGPALTTLADLRKDPEFAGHVDLSFVDADKVNNAAYVNEAVELSRPGAIIIVDNIVRQGTILNASSDDPAVQGSREVLELLGSHPRLSSTALQTVGRKSHDGFGFAIVTG